MREKSNINKYLNIAIGLIVMIVFHFLPPFTGMTQSAMAVLGTFLGSLYLWITVGIDWPSLLCIASLAFIPEIGIDKALMNSFGNATFAFLLFTFMCTYALSQTNFIKRIALKFVTSSIAQKGPWLMAGAFFLAVMFSGLATPQKLREPVDYADPLMGTSSPMGTFSRVPPRLPEW